MVSSYPFVLGINSSFTFNDFLSSDLYTLTHLHRGNAAFLIRHFAGWKSHPLLISPRRLGVAVFPVSSASPFLHLFPREYIFLVSRWQEVHIIFFSVQLSPEPCITLFILPSLSGYVVGYYLSFHICNTLGLTVILWWQYNILLVQAFVLLWHFQLPSHHSVVVMDADIFLHIKANTLAKPVSDFHSSNLMLSFSVQPTSVSASASFYLPSNFFITSILAINFAYGTVSNTLL